MISNETDSCLCRPVLLGVVRNSLKAARHERRFAKTVENQTAFGVYCADQAEIVCQMQS